MIVVGVDPGARETGVTVIDDSRGLSAGGSPVPLLLASTTIRRDKSEPLLEVPPAYLRDVIAVVLSGIREFDVELLAVERVTRPSWHVKRGSASGRGGAAADPTALLATAIVLGAVLSRPWTVPLVTVAPDGNGKLLPLRLYPRPLCTDGAGNDKRRHERAAYDVATMGPGTYRFARATGGGVYA